MKNKQIVQKSQPVNFLTFEGVDKNTYDNLLVQYNRCENENKQLRSQLLDKNKCIEDLTERIRREEEKMINIELKNYALSEKIEILQQENENLKYLIKTQNFDIQRLKDRFDEMDRKEKLKIHVSILGELAIQFEKAIIRYCVGSEKIRGFGELQDKVKNDTTIKQKYDYICSIIGFQDKYKNSLKLLKNMRLYDAHPVTYENEEIDEQVINSIVDSTKQKKSNDIKAIANMLGKIRSETKESDFFYSD